MLKYIMVTGTAYNTFFYTLCWDTTGYVYIYMVSAGLRPGPALQGWG